MPVIKKSPAQGKKKDPVVLAQVVYEGLCQEIANGQLAPGQVLSRRKIARRYGTSYSPVVEAMVRLEHAGLIEPESSQMARVRKVNVEMIQGLYELREACETQTIRLACERATATEIDELYRLAEAVDAHLTKKNYDAEGLIIHWQFHERIAEVSRSQVLLRQFAGMGLLERLKATWTNVPGTSDLPRWHSLLIDAIKNREPVTADAVMREHVRDGLKRELATRLNLNLQ